MLSGRPELLSREPAEGRGGALCDTGSFPAPCMPPEGYAAGGIAAIRPGNGAPITPRQDLPA